MINVKNVVLSRNFAQPKGFIVHRQTGSWVRGTWQSVEEAPITLSGTIIVATADDLEQVPEGDRVKGAMAFYSPQQIYVTRETGTSDQIDWRGERYRIYHVAPWEDFGYYKAIGVRMLGV
ncbi:hypothetical protein SAMN04487969_102503 [Paenibacillus algorifonticola]|uniref:Uncharacterized protein n=1 Tax=Paenibacillus algorifonticola TaxID=684063 RepID=A0A1I2AKZ0_9BACL|nr:hypothetical protein [Paenibacillus algorifonticola]SFE43540.1 hypothetical protein SAMN04487969_102503 [Paenibacillus algorifonticola]